MISHGGLRLNFDRRLKLEFHGSRTASPGLANEVNLRKTSSQQVGYRVDVGQRAFVCGRTFAR